MPDETEKLDTIAKRLRFAQKRAGLSTKQAMAELQLLKARKGRKKRAARTFYSHKADDDREPEDEDIEDYADLYKVTRSWLRYGEGDLTYTATIYGGGWSGENATSDDDGESAINQNADFVDLKASHNFPVRHIAILSTGELKLQNKWSGDLAQKPARTMPVPDDISASAASFGYRIPKHDLAMVSREGVSLPPGTWLIVDPEQPILPGEYVLADVSGFDDPVFRIYEAARPYTPGVPFTLRALNPAYQAIAVDASNQPIKIAVVIVALANLLHR